MAENLTVRALVQSGAGLLAESSRSPRLDAEVLLRSVLGWSRTRLLANEKETVSESQAAQYRALLARRLAGEPVAYITGSKEFFGRDFAVSPAVLCPRPETELLVERALAVCSERSEPLTFIDLGTGTGCIAVTLAAELSDRTCPISGIAVDTSESALAVARENAERLQVSESVTFLHSDWFTCIEPGITFDLVLSNPPYVSDGQGQSPELAFEPASALYAGADGLDAYRALFQVLAGRVHAGSVALFEIGCDQADALQALVPQIGIACQTSVHTDLAGLDRVFEIRFR